MKKLEKKEREKDILNLYLIEKKHIEEIAVFFNTHRKTIYRVLERNKVELRKDEVIDNICECCGREFPKKQSKRRKRCDTCNTAIRRIRLKRKCVEYKSGKCVKCGRISENDAIFDFHHLDPNKKEFNLTTASVAKMPWDEVKKELDKCVLICSNCHRLEHSQYEKYKKYL
jgi:translation initiation factor IF-2